MAANAPNLTNVINPNGELVAIDSAHLADAVNYGGYRIPSSSELTEIERKAKYGSGILNPLKAGAESAASALTFGVSREAENASGMTTPEAQEARQKFNPVASAVGTAAGLGAGLLLTPEAEGVEGTESALQAAREAGNAEKIAGAKEALKSAKLAFTPADLLNPVGAVTKAGGNVSKAVTGMVMPEGAGLASKILATTGGHAVGSAIEGAAYGLGQSVDENALGDPDALGEKLLPNMIAGAGIAGLIGGGIGGAGETLSGVGKMMPGSKDLAVKMLSTFGGVSESDIRDYLANREAVSSAPEFEDVYQSALGHVQDIHDQVASRQMDFEQAKAALAEKKRELTAQVQDLGYDTKKAKTLAQDALDQAQEKLQGQVQGQALDQAPLIHQAIQSLRENVIAGSSNAFEVLSQAKGKISLRGFYNKISDLQDQLRSQATLESKAMAERLGEYAENVKNEYGNEIRPPAAKLVIQGLDKISKFNHNASNFENGLASQYAQLRYHLDDILKTQVDGYAEAMKPVAEQTKLLKSLKDYGTPEDATRRIKSLKNVDRYRNEMPLLRELEQRTGAKFADALEPYANPEKNKTLKEALPEFTSAQKASEAHDALQNPRMKRAMQELEQTPEFQAHEKAKLALELAEAQKKDLGLTQTSLQGKLNAAMRGKNIEAARLIAQLPEFKGKSLPEILEHIRLKQVFEKGATNGSRHVNLYGGVLGAVGGVLAHHAMAGIGIGAALGGFMDKYGPQVTRRILDTVADQSMHVGTLSAIERAGQKTSQMLGQGAKAIFSGPVAASRVAAQEKGKAPDEDFADRLRGFIGNPDQAVHTLDQATRPLYYSAPKTSAALQQAMGRAASFLASKLPQEPAPLPLSPKLPPSQSELARFERYRSVVENPVSVLEQVRDGTVTPESMEALTTVYPKLYSEMSEAVMSALTDAQAKKKEIPYSVKLSLSTFLGQPLDHSMTQASIAASQSAMAQMGAPSSGAGPQGSPHLNQGGLAKLNPASRYLTAQEQAAQRSTKA